MSSLQPDSATTRSQRVLVVDDTPELLSALSLRLQRDGYRVASVSDGQQGLELFGANMASDPFGAVVTDISMPRMNGLVMAKAIRAIAPETPVIFMSGALPQGITQAQLQEVSPHILIKPFLPGALLMALQAELSKPLT